MAKVFVEELREGMELEQPVRDPFGIVLFSAGVRLTERTINALRMWGVTEVTIVDASIDPSAGAPAIDPAITAAAAQEIETLFAYQTKRGAFTTELIRYAVHRLAKRRTEEVSHEQ